MSKSTLVIETPKSCEECKLCVNVIGKHYCVAKGTNIAKGERDCSCPLVAVPEKINIVRPVCLEYQQGWNDCVDEMLDGRKKHQSVVVMEKGVI